MLADEGTTVSVLVWSLGQVFSTTPGVYCRLDGEAVVTVVKHRYRVRLSDVVRDCS